MQQDQGHVNETVFDDDGSRDAAASIMQKHCNSKLEYRDKDAHGTLDAVGELTKQVRPNGLQSHTPDMFAISIPTLTCRPLFPAIYHPRSPGPGSSALSWVEGVATVPRRGMKAQAPGELVSVRRGDARTSGRHLRWAKPLVTGDLPYPNFLDLARVSVAA
ncbi:hypothetical protein VKT23_014080 [Stygiomarasmius scandens]|uniref:Uncharacterized protein n=1 Tax=Marasmiellus scandens TaxID=2682957 RepID=A0ABR1J655_9AGAR